MKQKYIEKTVRFPETRISLSCECILHRYKSTFNLQNRDDAVIQRCQHNDVVLLDSICVHFVSCDTNMNLFDAQNSEPLVHKFYNPHIHSVDMAE